MKKNQFLKVCEPNTGYNDNDMGTQAQDFYREYFQKAVSYERGETWFTPIALLEKIYFIWSTIEPAVQRYPTAKYGSQLKQYKLDIISIISENVVGKVHRIGEDYHCLANFGCLPFELNTWRGAEDIENKTKEKPLRLDMFNRSRLGDFPDLFFESVKSYLSGGAYVADGYNANVEGAKLTQYDWWFEQIGGGKRCSWEEFVDAINIKGSFVDDKGEPIKLFKHKIDDPFPKLYLQGVSVEDLPNKISTVPEIRDCITKIYDIWENRAVFLSSLL